MNIKVKGLHWTIFRLADGTKKKYWYAWRDGPRLTGEPGSPEFIASYNAAVATKTYAGWAVAELLQGYQRTATISVACGTTHQGRLHPSDQADRTQIR